MSDKEVLQKAIEIAIENGMDIRKFATPDSIKLSGDTIQDSHNMIEEFKVPMSVSTIFSHDFAKAFWGDGEKIEVPEDLKEHTEVLYKILNPDEIEGVDLPQWIYSLPEWQYRLRNMVLEHNPIDYLRRCIENPNILYTTESSVVNKKK